MATDVMPKRNEHSWKEKTEDGEQRLVRAYRSAGQWRLASRLASEEAWEYQDPIGEADLRQLRDVLWRKYQRRRLPWEHVLEIDKLLGDEGEV